MKEALSEKVKQTREENTSYRVYTETDTFTANGEAAFSVLDFWRYQYCNLSSMASELAEFIVARALGIRKAENLSYWSAYDISYAGKRIEVKETRYVHAWNKEHVSNARTFSIAPTNNSYWETNPSQEQQFSRQNDIYVFCLNTNKDIEKDDPLNLDYWRFYVVPTFVINQYTHSYGNPNQKKISLGVVEKLAGRNVPFSELRNAVDAAIDRVNAHTEQAEK